MIQHLSLALGIEHLLRHAAVAVDSNVSWDTISVSRSSYVQLIPGDDGTTLRYRSALALPLGHHLQQPACQVAMAIAARFAALGPQKIPAAERLGEAPEHVLALLPHLTADCQDDWIEIRVAARGIFDWLHRVGAAPLPPSVADEAGSLTRTPNFKTLHAHARCHSLQQLIYQFHRGSLAPRNRQVPPSQEALSPEQMTLLIALVQACDRVGKAPHSAASSQRQLVHRQALSGVSDAFYSFHAARRMFAPFQVSRPWEGGAEAANADLSGELVQADLALLRATQQILAHLMVNLGVRPPNQL